MKMVTICGVDESEIINGCCSKCGNGIHCDVRPQDWVSEQIYNFCKTHNCLKPFGNDVFTYDKWLFLHYLEKHPKEIHKRKWLQEIANQNNILV